MQSQITSFVIHALLRSLRLLIFNIIQMHSFCYLVMLSLLFIFILRKNYCSFSSCLQFYELFMNYVHLDIFHIIHILLQSISMTNYHLSNCLWIGSMQFWLVKFEEVFEINYVLVVERLAELEM